MAAEIGSWRLDRPNVEPQFFDGPIEAIVEADLKGEHVLWWDSFDYARYNRGRVA